MRLLALAGAGMVLPLLPTVPFLLLAAFLFARSSRRAHHWLMEHRIFGRAIRRWQEEGAIDRRSKYLATLSMFFVFLFSFALGLRWELLSIQVLVLGIVLFFIWSRPERTINQKQQSISKI